MNRHTVVRLAPHNGTALVLRAGQMLRITDPEGKHIAELGAFDADDARVGVFRRSARPACEAGRPGREISVRVQVLGRKAQRLNQENDDETHERTANDWSARARD